MKKVFAIFLSALLLSACLAGCGEKADNELNTIENGKLIMSTNAEFPPYETTTDDGGFAGIDIEIAQAIADKLGLELVIDDMDFDTALTAVQTGKSDMVMAGVTADEDRMKVMNFSISYATGVQVIIVKEGSDVTLENLGQQLFGSQMGTTSNIYCSDSFGSDHVVTYDSSITAVQALLKGQLDCVVVDNAPAQELVKNNPGLKILDTAYMTESYAIGFSKKNTVLLEAVNKALEELMADGTIQSIIDKYIH